MNSNAIKWISTITGIIGAMIVASNNGLQMIGYAFFLTSSITWLYNSFKENDKAFIVQSGFFMCINAYGVLNYGIL